jgi:molybdopterin converting factor small subunit
MTIKLQYFGLIAACCGLHKESMQLPEGSTVADLRTLLIQKYPDLGSKSFQLARNLKIAADTEVLKEADELALLPPFAGG